MDRHLKHAGLIKAHYGHFHRNELNIAAPFGKNVEEMIPRLFVAINSRVKIAFVQAICAKDESCCISISSNDGMSLMHGVDPASFRNASKHKFIEYQQLLAGYNLVLLNGDYYEDGKHKLSIRTAPTSIELVGHTGDVPLIIWTDGLEQSPYPPISPYPDIEKAILFKSDNIDEIADFLIRFRKRQVPVLNGLVLAGGLSKRMGTDKGSIEYYGKSQRRQVYELLAGICKNSFVSYGNENMVEQSEDLPFILDNFLKLGPLSGILSAFCLDPDAAWLTVACDLPLLTLQTLTTLVSNRDFSKLATTYYDSEERFPEPLITIWEPRAYPLLLQYLALGYSCPRKVLINADIKIIRAPNPAEFKNVNNSLEKTEAISLLASRR